LEAPQADLLHALVHQARASVALDVLVEGQLVVSEGVSTLVDEFELMIDAEWARDLWRDLPAGPGGEWFPPSPPQGW